MVNVLQFYKKNLIAVFAPMIQEVAILAS